MGRFLRKRKRELERTLTSEANKGAKMRDDAKKAVYHATGEDLKKVHKIKSEVYDKMMLIFDAAVHDALGFGFERRSRLHKKMMSQIECLRGRYVTTKDMFKILADEADVHFVDYENLSKCNYFTREKKKTQAGMEAVFLLSLFDEFGKRSWLKKAYHKAGEISNKLCRQEITFDTLRENLNKKAIKQVA